MRVPGDQKKSYRHDDDFSLITVERCYILLFEKVDDDDGVIYFGVKSDNWDQYAGTTCLFGGKKELKESDAQTIIRELKEESKSTFSFNAKAILFHSCSHHKFYWAPTVHGPIGDLHANAGDELKDIVAISALHLCKYAGSAKELGKHLNFLVGATGGGAIQFLNSYTLQAIQLWLKNIFPTLCPGIRVWP